MTCVALTHSGRPCRYRTHGDRPFCANHDPDGQVQLAARNRRNARRPNRNASLRLLNTALSLEDAISIKGALNALVRLQLSGRIPDQRARTILRSLQAAARLLPPANRVTTTLSPAEASAAYFQRVQGLLATIDPLLNELAEAEAAPGGQEFEA